MLQILPVGYRGLLGHLYYRLFRACGVSSKLRYIMGILRSYAIFRVGIICPREKILVNRDALYYNAQLGHYSLQNDISMGTSINRLVHTWAVSPIALLMTWAILGSYLQFSVCDFFADIENLGNREAILFYSQVKTYITRWFTLIK